MKKRIAALALSGALLLSGCGSSDPGAETQPRQTEPVSTVTSTETTQTTLPFPTETVSELAGDALSLLRADMKPHMAALGYFGYFDEEIFDTAEAMTGAILRFNEVLKREIERISAVNVDG